MVLNPITLPASKILATMTALIAEMRFNDTLAPSDIVNDLVDSCRIGKVEYGKGIIYTFKTGLQPRKTLSETSSAFTITKPQVAQETILIDNYYFYPLSTNEVLTHDAVINGTMIANFFNFIMGLMEDSATFDLFDVCNALYQNWVPGQATQTITIDLIDPTGLTGADLNATLQYNASKIAKTMRKTLNNMKVKNSKYTDVATYVDANDGTTKPVISALRSDNLKIVYNDKFYTDFLADAMASLYHNEKIGDMIPGDTFVLLPEDTMKAGNENVIAWLSDKQKFALADYYKLTRSIQDPSTLYENYFHHIAYGAGVFTYAPGVKFVANYITPTNATIGE